MLYAPSVFVRPDNTVVALLKSIILKAVIYSFYRTQTNPILQFEQIFLLFNFLILSFRNFKISTDACNCSVSLVFRVSKRVGIRV